MASGTAVYRLTFTREMYNVPILQNVGKRFRLTLNIRRAILSEEAGWAEVALTGSTEEIGRAIADLHTTGVNITGPLAVGDSVEPEGGPTITPIPRGS
jgi:hypothetical protein